MRGKSVPGNQVLVDGGGGDLSPRTNTTLCKNGSKVTYFGNDVNNLEVILLIFFVILRLSFHAT